FVILFSLLFAPFLILLILLILVLAIIIIILWHLSIVIVLRLLLLNFLLPDILLYSPINSNYPSVNLLSVDIVNSLLSLFLIPHVDKTETSQWTMGPSTLPRQD